MGHGYENHKLQGKASSENVEPWLCQQTVLSTSHLRSDWGRWEAKMLLWSTGWEKLTPVVLSVSLLSGLEAIGGRHMLFSLSSGISIHKDKAFLNWFFNFLEKKEKQKQVSGVILLLFLSFACALLSFWKLSLSFPYSMELAGSILQILYSKPDEGLCDVTWCTACGM